MGAGVVIKDLYPVRQFGISYSPISVPSAFLHSAGTPAGPATTPPEAPGRGGPPGWLTALLFGLVPVSDWGRSHLALIN